MAKRTAPGRAQRARLESQRIPVNLSQWLAGLCAFDRFGLTLSWDCGQAPEQLFATVFQQSDRVTRMMLTRVDFPSEGPVLNTRFANIFSDACPRPLYDTVLRETGTMVVTPTLGSIIPNWVLAIPKRHAANAARWAQNKRHVPLSAIKDITRSFGIDYSGGQRSLAAVDRGARRQCEVSLSFRRAGLGGEIDPRRDSLAALHPRTARVPRAFLAIRRLGDSRRALGDRGGLAAVDEPYLVRVPQVHRARPRHTAS